MGIYTSHHNIHMLKRRGPSTVVGVTTGRICRIVVALRISLHFATIKIYGIY